MQFNKQIVLASKSPRRKDLLKEMGLDFMIHPSEFEEKDKHLTPEELAIHNALGKAQDVARHYKDSIIIGVDTVVAVNEHQLGKPKDPEDAKDMLRLLSNTTHKVISALCVMDSEGKKVLTLTEETKITMERLDESDIDGYVKSGEGVDKAAGYAIQGKGALFISKIEGDYFNVVGLPIYRLKKLLQKFGFKQWF